MREERRCSKPKTEASFIDIHAHICSFQDRRLAEAEIRYRRAAGIRTVFSAGTPEEWEYLRSMLPCEEISFGIHPWYADQYEPGKYQDLYRECVVIGEIGMDTLWCDVPLERQKMVFEAQLLIAADLQKPVVLHTKNCEAQIAEIIRGFPCPVLVHWYSGDEKSLTAFLEQGCFFTLGPDTSFQADSLLLSQVPQDHLLTETDGIEAIRWAYEEAGIPVPQTDAAEPAPFDLISHTLHAGTECYAKRFRMSEEEALRQIETAYIGFLQS
ncbi:MAG: TatD family hydrolase [Parasporobacterium sp.]|nr:TatD family hydrolase [Parasporobacterium sp.]